MPSYIADKIMREYRRKKQYEKNKEWSRTQNQKKEEKKK